jgi:transcription initiation factor IIE alpha subunit
MKYSFTCPACGHPLTVEAHDDQEAIDKLMDRGETHMQEMHREGFNVSQEQMRGMVRSQMKKAS